MTSNNPNHTPKASKNAVNAPLNAIQPQTNTQLQVFIRLMLDESRAYRHWLNCDDYRKKHGITWSIYQRIDGILELAKALELINIDHKHQLSQLFLNIVSPTIGGFDGNRATGYATGFELACLWQFEDYVNTLAKSAGKSTEESAGHKS